MLVQIALGNVSKYLLNGHKSEQSRIHTLFQSVQLNINNPNFVIMQGRITKVRSLNPFRTQLTLHRYSTCARKKFSEWSKKPLGRGCLRSAKTKPKRP